MSEIDYQRIADQINAAYGTYYTARTVEAIILQITNPKAIFPEKIIWEINTAEHGTFQFLRTAPKMPDRIYRKNPNMSDVDILRRAVVGAGYQVVKNKGEARKEKSNVDR